MRKPSTTLWHLLFGFVICFSPIIQVKGQCNTSGQQPALQCIDAPLTCLQNACYSTSLEHDQGWNGFCGPNTAVHNPQYFEIIPVEECIVIMIHINSCSSGVQLQAALVSSCNWQPCPGAQVPCPDVLDCDPGQPVGGTMIMNVCDLVPGESIWLLIDGSSGALCEYTIEMATGIYMPPIEEDIHSAEAIPNAVCQGYNNVLLHVDTSINYANNYMWVLGWNGDTITSPLSETQINIPQDAPPGVWEVCVSAFSSCDTTDIPFCFPIEIIESNITTEASLCCAGTACGLCQNLELNFTGSGPWGVVISDGNTQDTVEGIETTPYLHQVCYDFPAFVEYSIVEILTPSDDCNTSITGGPVAIHFFEPAIPPDVPWIVQTDSNTLCALPDYSGYSWHTCDDSTVIGSSECIDVESDGCYCVDILFFDSCAFTWCTDILLSTVDISTPGIKIQPNPSNGKINIDFSESISFPLTWSLTDHLGRRIDTGVLLKGGSEVNFNGINSGLYFLVLENKEYRVVRKVVFTK